EWRPGYLCRVLERASGLQSDQMSGPAGLKDSFYDIVATFPKGATRADIPAMLQRMMAERFHLTVHRETRMTPVYAITVGKDGPKLDPCEGDACPKNRAVTVGEESMVIQASTVAYLAMGLQDGADRPVMDRTGLAGNFKIDMQCAQQNAMPERSSTQPSMSMALQKLGLKLAARREESEYLIVDGGNRVPVEN